MLTNDIKKGAKLKLTGNREGTMADNKKGIIRMVEIDATNGWFNDIGSVYINEILTVNGEAAEITSIHHKQLDKIGVI